MIRNKRGMELALGTVITIIILLIVLVVVATFFLGGTSAIFGPLAQLTNNTSISIGGITPG